MSKIIQEHCSTAAGDRTLLSAHLQGEQKETAFRMASQRLSGVKREPELHTHKIWNGGDIVRKISGHLVCPSQDIKLKWLIK
jgi:hypothetical protein